MSGEHLALGVLAAAAAGAFIDGAVAFQADEAQKVGRKHGLKLSLIFQLIRKPQWLVATGGQAIGAALQVLALTLAPLTVVQPTLALGLVVLLLIGAHRFHEHVGLKAWLAVGAMVAGVALLAIVAPAKSTQEPDIWRVLGVALVLLLPMTIVRLRGEGKVTAPHLIVGAGCGFALSAIALKLLSDSLETDDLLGVLAFGALAGVGALGGQVLDMTALQRYQATHVAPPIFAMEIVVPVALAPWLFHETWDRPILVLVGLGIVVAGGIAVANAPAVQHIQEEDQPPGAGAASGGPPDAAAAVDAPTGAAAGEDASPSAGDGRAHEPEHDVRG